MRAYLKLAALVLLAAGIQSSIQWHIEQINNAILLMRLTGANALGRPYSDEETSAMGRRAAHRGWFGQIVREGSDL